MLKCGANCDWDCTAGSITPQQFSYTIHKAWPDTDSLCRCTECWSRPQECQQFSFISSTVILAMIYRYTKLENLNRLDAGVLCCAVRRKPSYLGFSNRP
jgi:hypothetical protein